MKSADWTRQAERSNPATLELMRGIATLCGRRIARIVLYPITLYFMLFGGVASRESARYLRRVLGRPPRWFERYRHIHHFAATILDRVYLLQERFDGFEIVVNGAEHLDELLKQGRGALLVGAHFGSFEVLRSLGQARRGLRVAMVMYEENAQMMKRVLDALAPEDSLHIIALGRIEAMLRLRDWLDAGGVAGMLADRTLPGPAHKAGSLHATSFLGERATISDGPFRLAALLHRRVLFMAGIYHGGNRYELRFLPLADFSQRESGARQHEAIAEAVSSYTGMLERLCIETPYNWFNFFDFWATPGSPDDHDASVDPHALASRTPRT